MTGLYLPVVGGKEDEDSAIRHEIIHDTLMIRISKMGFQNDMDPQAKIY